MSIEQAVEITAKLYETRKCVQDLYGDAWRSKLQPYMDELERVKLFSGVSYLKLGQSVAHDMQEQGINPLMLLAAMVELIEPTEVTS